ncbi:MAG: hypothetical protein H0U39_09010 [Segetibacter sp.]|jgi:hypothetical protein|nr:hypothetical protein [Segetibacter sp.]
MEGSNNTKDVRYKMLATCHIEDYSLFDKREKISYLYFMFDWLTIKDMHPTLAIISLN